MRRQLASTAGWGLYCACSWTWCIGMFLPIVLLQRWGWAGLLAFALPNILGCAAFGYIVRSPDRSAAILQRHGPAVRCFSLITIAYHVFFIGFVGLLLSPLPAEPPGARLWVGLAGPVGLLGLGLLLSAVPLRAWPLLAVAVYGLSIWVFTRLGTGPLLAIPAGPPEETGLPLSDLAWLAPTLIFGFLLCPYLDPTFHRAVQAGPSRHAFAVFAIAFAVMILLTGAYWEILEHERVGWIIAGHFAAQSLFTVAVHLRELRFLGGVAAVGGMDEGYAASGGPSTDNASPRTGRHIRAFLRSSAVAVGVSVALPLLAMPLAFLPLAAADPLGASVDLYVRFLVFYGLVFPAYVLLFIAARNERPALRPLLLYSAAVLIALPLYEMGFIREMMWLLPIPLVVLLGLAMIRR